MPTLKKRVSITLSDEHYAILSRLSVVSKTPKATIIGDLIAPHMPSLAQLTSMLEQAQKAPKDAKDGIHVDFANAVGDLISDAESSLISLKEQQKEMGF